MDYPFIPLPKWFVPLCPLLNGTEVKVMLVIFDQTLGWEEKEGQRQTTNILAYTFLQNQTGITSRTQISNALKKLESLGLIKREAARMRGQRIEVSIVSPIVPIELVKNRDSGVSNRDSQSLDSGLPESRIETHIKKQQKEPNKETTTPEKLTPVQEESLALLLLNGLSEKISRRLILDAWSRGRDSEYISRSVGYAIQNAKTNLQGYIRRWIERNNDVIPPSQPILSPSDPVKLDKWSHGGVNHRFVAHQCEICHPELIAQREAREAAWLLEDQQEAEDA